MRKHLAAAILITFMLAVLPGAAWAMTMDNTYYVDAKAVLFDAGKTTPTSAYGGVLPIYVDVSPIAGGWVTFSSVTGTLKAGTVWPEVGPDGGTDFGSVHGTNVFSANGVSGIIADRFQFLAGVFTTDAGPNPSNTPARLNFQTIGTDFSQFSPVLNQSFFIGDGLTGTGSGATQKFYVPAGATALYLGFIDSGSFGWPSGGNPSFYSDNTGTLTATLDLHAVPLPAAIWLLGPGLLGLLGLRRKFRA